MQTQFVFRHMESSDAMRSYAEERLTKIRDFSDPLKTSHLLGGEAQSYRAARRDAQRVAPSLVGVDGEYVLLHRHGARQDGAAGPALQGPDQSHQPSRGRSAKIRSGCSTRAMCRTWTAVRARPRREAPPAPRICPRCP